MNFYEIGIILILQFTDATGNSLSLRIFRGHWRNFDEKSRWWFKPRLWVLHLLFSANVAQTVKGNIYHETMMPNRWIENMTNTSPNNLQSVKTTIGRTFPDYSCAKDGGYIF